MRLKKLVLIVGLFFITALFGCGRAADVNDSYQSIYWTLERGNPPYLTVYLEVPVRLVIEANEEQITGCNRVVHIPELDIYHEIEPGTNLILFTPLVLGTFTYTCAMGNLQGTIVVHE